MAEIIRYGAYVPRGRAPLGEIQKFFGRPGRPRSKALATPSLDEDTLTMAYEASLQALADGQRPGTLIAISQSPPFKLRKLAGTLARTLGLDGVTPIDLAGNGAALLDGFALAQAIAGSGGEPVLVVASDHLVSYEERVCDTLSAGAASAYLIGASGGFATLGQSARASREVYDIWVLGNEPEARYRLEVLFETYGAVAKEALTALGALTERATGDYAAVCPSQPHPQTLRGLGKAGVSSTQLEHTSFVGEIGNLGAASVGVSLALGLDRAAAGESLVALGYGGGEAIAQEITLTAAPTGSGTAEALGDSEAISLSTYYRWTRGRQAEPH